MTPKIQYIGKVKYISVLLVLLFIVGSFSTSCRQRSDQFVIGLESAPETLDPLRGADASGERFRQLMFNSLVRKNERFEYVGDLAETITTSDDRLSVTFTLHPNVTFHDGTPLTARDAKYTIDTLTGTESKDYKKAPPFFEGTGEARQPLIASVEARDERTLVIRLRRPWNDLLANLTPIGIIPVGSAPRQAQSPLGSGAYKFSLRDESQGIFDFEAYDGYWQGAPNIKRLRVRVILDANTLQAELLSGRVDMVVSAVNLTPDAYPALARSSFLEVKQFPGANIVYLGFNTENEIVRDARVRQAIAYAINREEIISKLLRGQAQIAHSIVPEGSWAFASGETYTFDPARAKTLLDQAGFIDPDGDGPRMRFSAPLNFKMSSANATRQYGGVIQNQLKAIGIPVSIETLEQTSLGAAQRAGQYQITTGRWVGGNQDPIFLRDLFTSAGSFNRSRYKDAQLDILLNRAVTSTDRNEAKQLYVQAQDVISRELPMFPLWYPATMVVVRRGVENMQIDPSGDWSFVRNLRIKS